MRILDRWLALARTISRYGALMGGFLLLAASAAIGIDVVIRKAFVATIGGADELAGYALAISSAWAFSFALLERAHIRIDSLYVILPVRLCAILDIAALAAFGFFMSVVAWHAYGVLEQTVATGARSMSSLGTPLTVPQLLWWLGLVLFVAVNLLLLVRALALFVTGDLRTLQSMAGSRSAVEEVEAEIKGLEEVRAADAKGGSP
ncbi:MAG: TRAP transporter small permease subunit [Pseudomonadota bacterium]